MEKTRLTVGGCSVSLFAPTVRAGCPIVYAHIGEAEAEAVAARLGGVPLVLAAVDGADWEKDLSPWPAPKVFRRGHDFAGGANAYLRRLTETVVPGVEESLAFTPRFRAVAGYSLAGLFAVYALYRTDIFDRAASVSGSLWYDGFLDFMGRNSPKRKPDKVYFSLGDRESRTGDRRLSTGGTCTAEAERLMRGLGAVSVLELYRGNHFADVPERIAKGLRWLSV